MFGNDDRTNQQMTAQFIAEYSVYATSVFDESLEVFDTYGVSSIPVFYVVGEDSNIVGHLEGERSYDELSALIEEAM